MVLPTVAVGLLFSTDLRRSRRRTARSTRSSVSFGIAPVDWFGSGAHAFVVIIVMDLWRSMGFYAVLLYAGLVEIPEEIIESARLDGASGFRLVRTSCCRCRCRCCSRRSSSASTALKVFDSILALNNGGPGTATTPLNLYMFQTSFTYSDYGYGSTLALLITVLCLSVTLLIFRRPDAT